MTDYSESGAVPVEDASIDDPPTVDEVIERKRRDQEDGGAPRTNPFPSELAADDDDDPLNAPTNGDEGGGG
jgi:hypothetical protein